MYKNKNLTGYPSIDKPWLKYYDRKFDEKELPKMTMYELAYLRNKDNMSNTAIEVRISKNDFNKGIKITYREFFQQIEKCAKALKALGVIKNEIIPIVLPNVPEARVLIYANSSLGAISYPISPFIPANQFKKIIAENNIKTVVMFEAFYEKYEDVLETTNIRNMILLNGTESMPAFVRAIYKIKSLIVSAKFKTKYKILEWNDFIGLHKQAKELIPAKYSKNHIAAIIGTSGTTGTSKGVCLSDDNMNAAALAYLECLEGSCLDILIPSIAYGLAMLHYQMISGEKTYLIPELITDKITELICKTQPDTFSGGPVHYINIAQSVEFINGELPKMKNTICGGATLPKETEENLNGGTTNDEENEVSDRVFVRQGFALTESNATGTYSKRGAYKFGSVGIPLPYVTVSIFQPNTDEELTYGKKGEICISSPTMMQHYLNNPIETNDVIRIHKDGKRWIHTKDIGYMDESGHLFHVDRIKNIFMRTGFNVHPSTISEFINSLNYVENSHVIGFEHPLEQCVPIAFIVAEQNCGKNNDEIEAYIKEECYKNLEETSVPYGFVFVNKFPINLGGKIDGIAIKKQSGINLIEKDVIPKKRLYFS